VKGDTGKTLPQPGFHRDGRRKARATVPVVDVASGLAPRNLGIDFLSEAFSTSLPSFLLLFFFFSQPQFWVAKDPSLSLPVRAVRGRTFATNSTLCAEHIAIPHNVYFPVDRTESNPLDLSPSGQSARARSLRRRALRSSRSWHFRTGTLISSAG
jgi:hypothetical protein